MLFILQAAYFVNATYRLTFVGICKFYIINLAQNRYTAKKVTKLLDVINKQLPFKAVCLLTLPRDLLDFNTVIMSLSRTQWLHFISLALNVVPTSFINMLAAVLNRSWSSSGQHVRSDLIFSFIHLSSFFFLKA